MSRLHPILIILIGFVLMIVGVIFPYLMLPSVNVIKSSFPLIFLTYTVQVSGLFLGIIGTAMLVRLKKK